MKTIYFYNRDRVHTTKGDYPEDRPCKLPDRATFEKPPKTNQNEVAVYQEDIEEWTIKPDYRGQTFYDEEGNKHTITELGKAPKEDWTRQRPLTEKEKLEKQLDKLKEEYDKVALGKSKLELINASEEEIEELREEAQEILDEIVEVNIKLGEVDTDE